MNKLEGFHLLNQLGLPSVPWKAYTGDTILAQDILWTIRSAVAEGEDFNLPRLVGVSSSDAKRFADNLKKVMHSNDLILYYPYFIAMKSGVIEVSPHRVVIEAVQGDLWNLVTHNQKDVTMLFEDNDLNIIGDELFFSETEIFELIDYCNHIKKKFQKQLFLGQTVYLEWSYGAKSDLNRQMIGGPSLIFYEVRTIKG